MNGRALRHDTWLKLCSWALTACDLEVVIVWDTSPHSHIRSSVSLELNVPQERWFTYGLHSAKFQNMATFIILLWETKILYNTILLISWHLLFILVILSIFLEFLTLLLPTLWIFLPFPVLTSRRHVDVLGHQSPSGCSQVFAPSLQHSVH
jgi:hypothetical protein